ncbi:MAG: sugar ABC transporter permease, partial [Anaerolineae bacterium]|nr:sugar ABC transporter permease [Anaerolineae bacterium]
MITQAHIETLIWSAATIAFIAIGSFLVAQLARWLAGRFGLSMAEQNKVYWGFLFASPWLIGFVIFVLGPALASLYYSFTDYKLGQQPGWVGLENYRDLIQAAGRDGRNFKRAMYNSLYYAIVGVPLQIVAALGMALLLNTTVRGVRLFRLIFYMPVILAGGPAILLAWRYMLSSNGGFVNETLIGLSEKFFLFDWFYRGFIFIAEGFNGFFIGLTNGNPTGPLNFFLPALIGAILALMLLLGDWEPGKRELARRAVEIIVFAIGGLLVAVGIVAEPIAIHWTFIWGMLVLLGWHVNQRSGQLMRARMWQIAGMGLIIIGLIFTVFTNPAPDAPDMRLGYLSAMVAAGVVIALTFIPRLDKRVILISAVGL